jgi:NAD(P)-dependent dehydrogenase (short-subunit alcohol dehydrogenase family)
VSSIEAAEVHVVNALAPFVLCTELRALLERSAPSHVINVSSMEGKFSRTKKATHPHTNMAKAALNMMTRTSADDWARAGVFMNAIDTGWITYENPSELTARKQELGLEPPIDEEDGAARILDPVFTAYRSGRASFGMFYKDYLPSKW